MGKLDSEDVEVESVNAGGDLIRMFPLTQTTIPAAAMGCWIIGACQQSVTVKGRRYACLAII